MIFKSTLMIGSVALAVAAFGRGDLNAKFTALQGHAVPSFKMTSTSGHVITSSSLRGKVVVLDFWATWCAPCKKASPVMERLHKEFGSRGLVVIGAETLDAGGAAAYAKEHGYTYTFTTKNDAFTTKLGIEAIPAFLIVGKDGKIVKTVTGVDANLESFYKTLATTIKPLLR